MKFNIALFAFTALLLTANLNAQPTLDGYLQHGLENNRMLKEKHLSIEQGMLALKEAKSYFLPSLSLISNYTTAEGGRIINLPIGDLMNPAYSALNQITGSNAFPTLDNVQEQFLPKNFYDARFRATYALLNNDLYVNRSVKSQSMALDALELEIFKQELTKDIKIAYYNYCIAKDALKIYESALQLLERNLLISKSLLENGKGLKAQVLRAESEIAQIHAQIANANSRVVAATQYFNFLINRPLDEEIIYEQPDLPVNIELTALEPTEVSQRLELKKIDVGININQTVLKSNERFAIPKLSSFLDFGSQGFDFEYNNQSRYYLLGVQLDMPLYQAGRNRLKISQSKLAIEKLQNSKVYVNEQLQLAANLAQQQLKAALVANEAASRQEKAALSYFNLIDRGYEEGVNSLIEFIDARNQFTNATLQQKITYYQVLSTYAEYQRQISSN